MQVHKLAMLCLAVGSNAFAADVEITGTVDQTISPAKSGHHLYQTAPKHIKLLKIKLSDKAKKVLKSRAASSYQLKSIVKDQRLPSQIQLGMNEVPVLDQGAHGSCATFANTAAIDAALGQGDYVSQLCLLQLGNYLQGTSYAESGWDGSFGRHVLAKMEAFGIYSKQNQQSQGCGGLTEYPLTEADPSSGMNLEDYKKNSENLFEHGIIWSPILDSFRVMSEATDTVKTIDEIKVALSQNKRVTMGTLLGSLNRGVAGAIGKHQVENDTWVLTPEIVHDIMFNQNLAGHEMVITGYDDNAVAIDDHGREHKGLFTLRNSWGSEVGYQGDFYITYDYFKFLALEAQQIVSASDEDKVTQ